MAKEYKNNLVTNVKHSIWLATRPRLSQIALTANGGIKHGSRYPGTSFLHFLLEKCIEFERFPFFDMIYLLCSLKYVCCMYLKPFINNELGVHVKIKYDTNKSSLGLRKIYIQTYQRW